MRRRIVWNVAALLIIAAAAIWMLLSALAQPFPVRAYGRLQRGMTLAEVEGAIGMPPNTAEGGRGPHTYVVVVREFGPPLGDGRQERHAGRVTVKVWTIGDYDIRVEFDENAKAVGGCLFIDALLCDRHLRQVGR